MYPGRRCRRSAGQRPGWPPDYVSAMLLLLALGCPRGAAPAPSVPAPPAPVALPAAALPPPSVDGLPGWLAIRVVAPGSGDGVSIDDSGPLAVVSEAWASVPAGTPLLRVDSTGVAPAPFLRSRVVKYGCDDTDVTIASFGAPSAERLAWLLPPGVMAEPIEVTRQDAPKRRRWVIGGDTLSLTEVQRDKVEVRSSNERHLLDVVDLDAQRMDGAEDLHLAVHDDFMVPQVHAAWRIGQEVVVGASYHSYEGEHFVVYTLGDTPAVHHVAYLYGCAF